MNANGLSYGFVFGHAKQGSHHLFALSHPFAGQRGGTDAEERAVAHVGDGLAKQGLTRSRWTE